MTVIVEDASIFSSPAVIAAAMQKDTQYEKSNAIYSNDKNATRIVSLLVIAKI